MKTVRPLFLLLTLFLAISRIAADEKPFSRVEPCEDEVCPVPTVDESNQPVYAIVSPVGYHAVDMIEQAPRLDALEGKNIALVGGSFMAAVTHDELRKIFQEKYPSTRLFMFQEVGTGGPYSVFGQSAQTRAFQNKLRELHIDAVISGNCGCGLCTTKETGSSIAAEYLGIPSVTIGAPTFVAQIRSTGVNRGVPALRAAEYPGAFASSSEEELRRNAREVLWPQIAEALTRPITQEEINRYAAADKRPYDEIVYVGAFDDVQEFCQINNWTDGLPVVPPTDALVREYLRFTPCSASDALGTFALAYRECYVYTAVVNAVMAGVPKELTPICVALTQALGDGEWRRPLASTHGWSPYAWLNGPLARQLGVDCGQGMISESTNKALGRFIDLMMLNLGGYYVKENRMGTFGYLAPFAFAEDEEACLRLGWTPYHVAKGYAQNANVVTASSALAWGNNVTPATDDPERIMKLLAFDITEKQQNGLGNTNPQVYRTVLITEPVAKDLAVAYKDKSEFENALVAEARRPLFMRAYANYWANTGGVQSGRYTFGEYYDKLRQDPREQAALTDAPEWLEGLTDRSQIETIATMKKGQTAFLIAGDQARNKFMTLPGGGCVSIEIKLPNNWDELVAPMGYRPLRDFYLEEQTPQTPTAEKMATARQERAEGAAVTVNLTDGEYRLVPSMEQLTAEGRVFKTADGLASAWAYGSSSAKTLSVEEAFADLMKGLFVGCSFTVRQGRVVGITLRPQSSGGRAASATGLSAELVDDLDVAISVVLRQNAREGKKTDDGATLVVSARLTKFAVDLGGEPNLDRDGSEGFLTLNGSRATLNPRAQEGASAKIGVKTPDGAWRTLTFVKRDRRIIEIVYRTNDVLTR
ncbi:MAG: hypothetical protein J6X44_07790 [Thermoguttaceae bacterium]|nr:hypothetical protein [Thermoguttaceae bacterium]